MQTKMLRVRAHGDASVPNYERLEQGVNCFIGRDFKEIEPGRFGFVPNDQVVEVPERAEYLKALRDGDLLAADAETAATVGLKLPPRPSVKAPTMPEGLRDSKGTTTTTDEETKPSGWLADLADVDSAKEGSR